VSACELNEISNFVANFVKVSVVIIVKVGLENMIDVRNRYILLLNVDK
jgi:hypothetical protein